MQGLGFGWLGIIAFLNSEISEEQLNLPKCSYIE